MSLSYVRTWLLIGAMGLGACSDSHDAQDGDEPEEGTDPIGTDDEEREPKREASVSGVVTDAGADRPPEVMPGPGAPAAREDAGRPDGKRDRPPAEAGMPKPPMPPDPARDGGPLPPTPKPPEAKHDGGPPPPPKPIDPKHDAGPPAKHDGGSP